MATGHAFTKGGVTCKGNRKTQINKDTSVSGILPEYGDIADGTNTQRQLTDALVKRQLCPRSFLYCHFEE
jgi:hypothetical protein